MQISLKPCLNMLEFTDDENQKTFRELFSSAEFIRVVDGELIFLSALNIFLFISAFLGNSLILFAIHKETSLHPPSKLLYGIIAQPLGVTNWISVVTEKWNIRYYALRGTRFSPLKD